MARTEFASQHRWMYVGAVVVLVAMVVTALLVAADVRRTNQATVKAEEFAAKLTEAGLPTPDTDTIANALGTDGDPVCADPGSDLAAASWQSQHTNGASGPGIRPVIADERLVEARRLAVEVYCPEHLDDIEDDQDTSRTDDTVKD